MTGESVRSDAAVRGTAGRIAHLRRRAGRDLLLLDLRRATPRTSSSRSSARCPSRGWWACRIPTTPSRPTTAGRSRPRPPRSTARSGAPGRLPAREGAAARRLAARRARPRDRHARAPRVLSGPTIRSRLGLRDTWFTFVRVSSSSVRAALGAPGQLGRAARAAGAGGRVLARRRGGSGSRSSAATAGAGTGSRRVHTTAAGRYRLDIARAGTYRVRSGSVAGPCRSRAVSRRGRAPARARPCSSRVAAAPSQAPTGSRCGPAPASRAASRLRVEARAGVELTVRDELTGAQRTLAPRTAVTILRRFATWSCAGTARRFTRDAGRRRTARCGTATAEVRTPTCAHRLALAGAAQRARRRAGRRCSLRDRWRLGGLRRAAASARRARGRRCRSVQLRPGRRERATSVPRAAAGRLPHHRRDALPAAAPDAAREPAERAAAHPRHRRLDDPDRRLVPEASASGSGPARVRSDARISTGLSKPSLLDWRCPRARAGRRHAPRRRS